MRKFLTILIITTLLIIGIWFYPGQTPQKPEEILPEELEGLGSIILKNTNFEDFNFGYFSFKYPDWQKLEMEPTLFLPEEIAQKEEVLLYLTNSDGVKFLATKRKVRPELLEKPYPLVLREVFTKNQEVLEEQGSLEEWYLIREMFFENGVLVESKVVVFGTTITSLQKSIIVYEDNSRFIYSVGISAREQTFEDYRSLIEFVMNSVRYY